VSFPATFWPVIFADALQWLAGLQRFGMRPGLETSLALAIRAGNPERSLRFIHVAGTNGKGSTCAMLESIYRAAGYRVGLYTSPHLVRFSERIQIDRQQISEADIATLVAEAKPWTEGLEVTFFEFVTLLALLYFARNRCDIVVWETGLGGRWDATNIVTPLASVITNIGWDHQQWLGDTLAKIAAEKAGIIKPQIPVVTGAALVPGASDPRSSEATALEVLRQRALELDCDWISVSDAELALSAVDVTDLALLGPHQRQNAAVAVATVRALLRQFPVPKDAIQRGLATVLWNGRLQRVHWGSGLLLLDGAHNLPGIQALVQTLEQEFPGRRPAVVLGVLADKEWTAMCEHLVPRACQVVVAPVASTRTADPELLAASCRRLNPGIPVTVVQDARSGLESVRDQPFVLATGSLYFLGEILEFLESAPGSGGSERGLNEWRSGVRP